MLPPGRKPLDDNWFKQAAFSEEKTHHIDWSVVKRLPTDYTDYGGEVERWKDDDNYPDCSCGCRWFVPVEGPAGCDWGVCTKPGAPRAGLLTFEHQTGRDCFEAESD